MLSCSLMTAAKELFSSPVRLNPRSSWPSTTTFSSPRSTRAAAEEGVPVIAREGVFLPGVDVMEARLGMWRNSSSVEAFEETPVRYEDGIKAGRDVVESALVIS